MANKTIVNFSLDPALFSWLHAQAELEDRPMSRIVSRLLTEYRASQASVLEDA
jgi:hypothetical protein